MALTSANVRVGVTGVISKAPAGTTRPTDTSTALNAAYKDLGYVGDGGVTESRPRSSTDLKAWQNAAIVRTVITDASLRYKFKLIETSKNVMEAFYAATTTGATSTEGTLSLVASATGGRGQWVIDVVDGTEKKRIDIGSGEITEVGDVVYASGEAIGYEVTLTCYPDAAGYNAIVYSTALKS